MESYKVGKVTHKVYDIDEVPKDIEFKQDWREGDKDDWTTIILYKYLERVRWATVILSARVPALTSLPLMRQWIQLVRRIFIQ